MNSIEIKYKRVRASSARNPPLRPTSGTKKNKVQFIQNIYTQLLPNRRSFNFKYKSENDDVAKFIPSKPTKSFEELYQQNLHLKQVINKLNQDIAIQRGQIQNYNKRKSKQTKQINIQFEKEMYWSGSNTHLVTGVKAQYEKLKAKYKTKCLEYDQLYKATPHLQFKQLKVYAQMLEQSISNLNHKLMSYESMSKVLHSSHETNRFLLVETQDKLHKLQTKIKQKNQQLKIAIQENKNKDKKMQFLQKLIITKDNAQYHTHKKSKKIQKQNENYQQQISILKNDINDIKIKYQSKIEQSQLFHNRKYNAEVNLFQNNLKEKQAKIQKLQKQVAYLSTLLSYWKPLDEMNTQSKLHKMQQKQQKNNIEMSLDIMKNSKSYLSIKNPKIKKGEGQPNQYLAAKESLNLQSMKDNNSVYFQESQKIKQGRYMCDKKNSESAVKKRKVKFDDIKQIGNLIRYRLIAKNISMDTIKSLFNSTQESNLINLTQPENNIYISMNEIIEILKLQIFNLNENERILLARYIVEDCNDQYVYCDGINQIERQIAKSILKAIIGDYQALSQEQRSKVEEQCHGILQKYKNNVFSALKTIAPSGIVSQKRFSQLLPGLGIQISPKGMLLLIGMMAIHSKDLQQLQYRTVFEG